MKVGNSASGTLAVVPSSCAGGDAHRHDVTGLHPLKPCEEVPGANNCTCTSGSKEEGRYVSKILRGALSKCS